MRQIAIVFLATLSFSSAKAQTDKQVESPTAVQPATKETSKPENITISGKVTMGNEIPVVNAKVTVGNVVTVYTDAEGKFSTVLSGEMITIHNLYFSYEGLERTVRTFHPMMGSANYDVRLQSTSDCKISSYNMGALKVSGNNYPSISFVGNPQALDAADENMLVGIAQRMKNNPSAKFQLVAYSSNAKEQKLAEKQIEIVNNFLTNKSGIGRTRIKKNISKGTYNRLVRIIEDKQ